LKTLKPLFVRTQNPKLRNLLQFYLSQQGGEKKGKKKGG